MRRSCTDPATRSTSSTSSLPLAWIPLETYTPESDDCRVTSSSLLSVLEVAESSTLTMLVLVLVAVLVDASSTVACSFEPEGEDMSEATSDALPESDFSASFFSSIVVEELISLVVVISVVVI